MTTEITLIGKAKRYRTPTGHRWLIEAMIDGKRCNITAARPTDLRKSLRNKGFSAPEIAERVPQ